MLFDSPPSFASLEACPLVHTCVLIAEHSFPPPQILGRRTKNNPCLVGEPGVGKSAIAEGLAQKIASNDVPETLEGKRMITLDMGLLVRGLSSSSRRRCDSRTHCTCTNLFSPLVRWPLVRRHKLFANVLK